MTSYKRWKDVRAAHVARAGGERAVEHGKQELLATGQGHRFGGRLHQSIYFDDGDIAAIA